MGFFMGLGLLVQKREDSFGSRLETKCYQVRYNVLHTLTYILHQCVFNALAGSSRLWYAIGVPSLNLDPLKVASYHLTIV